MLLRAFLADQGIAGLQDIPGDLPQLIGELLVVYIILGHGLPDLGFQVSGPGPISLVIPIAPEDIVVPKNKMRLAVRIAPIRRIQGQLSLPDIRIWLEGSATDGRIG